MNKKLCVLIFVLLCSYGFSEQKGDDGMTMTVTSSAFKEGHMIPVKYTCDGQNVSPPLNWQNAPPATKSFAIICDDPDAPVGTWVHWVVWNIPAEVNDLPAGDTAPLPQGTKQGMNDFHKNNYGGPCPPSGTHRYYFKVYALDTTLDLPNSTTKQKLLEAMDSHILAQCSLMGKYQRK